jgi:hypothetical protein
LLWLAASTTNLVGAGFEPARPGWGGDTEN